MAVPASTSSELAFSTEHERAIARRVRKNQLSSVSHEILENATEAVIGSTSEVAVAQELGTAQILPRLFLGRAAARKADEIAQISRLVITTSL